jgi:hypothetical protein
MSKSVALLAVRTCTALAAGWLDWMMAVTDAG